MEILGGIALGVGIVGAVIGIGFLIGYAISTPGRITEPGTSTPPNNCAEFCSPWQKARTDVCSARTDEETARANADAARNLWLATLAAAAVALGSAIAAALIPFIGPVLAAPLFAAHATLLATALLLEGIWAGLALAHVRKQQETGDAINAATSARQQVIDNCPEEERNRCLATPAPC